MSDQAIHFTIIPEKGSQVWSVLKIETLFDDDFTLQSATEGNTINLEVPIQALQRALRSAQNASSAAIRLTKKNNQPILCLTITSNTFSSGNSVPLISDEYGSLEVDDVEFTGDMPSRERETIITQDVPVKVLTLNAVDGLHEPRTPEPEIHIYLPQLNQVKSISDRFARLAASGKTGSSSSQTPRLELSANMHGSFKIAVKTDAVSISTVWTNLINPELDPGEMENGSQGVRNHPSARMRELGGEHGENEEGWAKVMIDARDWSRVLSIGRVGAKVVACKSFEFRHLVTY